MEGNLNEYQPGNCNIGDKELMVRKKFLNLFLFVSLALTAAGFLWPWSILVWLALVFTSFSAMVLWMEIRYHFCIIFGFFSLYNFKQLGHLDEVQNPNHQKKDRKRVTEIVILSMMIALIYATAIHLFAAQLNIH